MGGPLIILPAAKILGAESSLSSNGAIETFVSSSLTSDSEYTASQYSHLGEHCGSEMFHSDEHYTSECEFAPSIADSIDVSCTNEVSDSGSSSDGETYSDIELGEFLLDVLSEDDYDLSLAI